jgi:hypothetical protein
LLGYRHVAIGCRPKTQVPAALSGLENPNWLLVVRQLGRIPVLPPSIDVNHDCFAYVELGIAPRFKFTRGVEKDLSSSITLSQNGNVIHKGDIVELLGLFNPMADT